jgi:hypothetical protein
MAALSSCKKEAVKNTHSQLASHEKSLRYGTDGRMLIFYSVADYETTVTDPTEEDRNAFLEDIDALGYKSYSDYLAEDETRTDAVGEDFLAHVLNKDRIVQIGSYLYQVDILTGEVLVLPAAELDEYQDLADGAVSNPHIKKYSVEEDVIELVESGKESGEKGLCFEGYAHSRNESRVLTVDDLYDIQHKFRCEVSYYSGGVFFNLKSQMQAWTIYYDIDAKQKKTKIYEHLLKIECTRRYKKRCENENPWYSFGGIGLTNADGDWLKLHSYQGSKGLKRYGLKTNFWYKDGNGNWNSAWNGANMYADYNAGVTYGY